MSKTAEIWLPRRSFHWSFHWSCCFSRDLRVLAPAQRPGADVPDAAEEAPATVPQSVGRRQVRVGRVGFCTSTVSPSGRKAETVGGRSPWEGVWWRLSSGELPEAYGSWSRSATCPAGGPRTAGGGDVGPQGNGSSHRGEARGGRRPGHWDSPAEGQQVLKEDVDIETVLRRVSRCPGSRLEVETRVWSQRFWWL